MRCSPVISGLGLSVGGDVEDSTMGRFEGTTGSVSLAGEDARGVAEEDS